MIILCDGIEHYFKRVTVIRNYSLFLLCKFDILVFLVHTASAAVVSQSDALFSSAGCLQLQLRLLAETASLGRLLGRRSRSCCGGGEQLYIPSWQLHSAMPERRRDEFWRFLLVGRSSHLPCGLSWLTTGWSVHRVGDGSDQSSATLPINTHLFHHCLITLRGHISHAGSPVVGGLAYCTSSPHVHFFFFSWVLACVIVLH